MKEGRNKFIPERDSNPMIKWNFTNLIAKWPQCSIIRLNSNTPCLPVESFLQKCGYKGEYVFSDIFIKKCPVMFTHLNCLPNKQISITYMIAVRLELLKQLVFFGHILWHSCFLIKLKGRGYFLRASVLKLRKFTHIKFSKMQAGSLVHHPSTNTLQ